VTFSGRDKPRQILPSQEGAPPPGLGERRYAKDKHAGKNAGEVREGIHYPPLTQPTEPIKFVEHRANRGNRVTDHPYNIDS